MTQAPKVVAEIGCNHKGDLNIAKEMIAVAASFCKVDYIKFQKRNAKELLTVEQYNLPHPNPMHSFGDTYGAHREFLEFDTDQHYALKDYCESLQIGYATSVWDLTSAKEIVPIGPDYIKIPSATNQHYDLMGYLCDNFSGQIHVSLGMTKRDEEANLIQFFQDRKRAQDLVVYSCTSGYPVAFEDICLNELTRLREAYGSIVGSIGFSGHHLGIAADIAAQTLGAEWIERHFTVDRTWKGTDHSASLEPGGMRRLVRDTRAIAKALTYKPSELLDIELPQRNKLKWGLYNKELL